MTWSQLPNDLKDMVADETVKDMIADGMRRLPSTVATQLRIYQGDGNVPLHPPEYPWP
jgi:hypothetical protein